MVQSAHIVGEPIISRGLWTDNVWGCLQTERQPNWIQPQGKRADGTRRTCPVAPPLDTSCLPKPIISSAKTPMVKEGVKRVGPRESTSLKPCPTRPSYIGI